MKKLTTFLGVLLLVSCAQLAQAAYQISYSLTGAPGATTVGCVPTGDTLDSCFAAPTNIGGGVTITSLQGTSNSPGDATNSRQAGSTLEIDTTSAATLTIWLAAPN